MLVGLFQLASQCSTWPGFALTPSLSPLSCPSLAPLSLSSHPSLPPWCRRFYDFSLLSAESFFHIVAANTAFCSTIVDSNFRYAFWQRKRGCQCQHKAVVDWCGCSPMVFRQDDYGKLKVLDAVHS